jgi:hypothetical protein
VIPASRFLVSGRSGCRKVRVSNLPGPLGCGNGGPGLRFPLTSKGLVRRPGVIRWRLHCMALADAWTDGQANTSIGGEDIVTSEQIIAVVTALLAAEPDPAAFPVIQAGGAYTRFAVTFEACTNFWTPASSTMKCRTPSSRPALRNLTPRATPWRPKHRAERAGRAGADADAGLSLSCWT